ncbi:MATE family efflux transporter [Ureaplasma miroungigenitalium]|uniref:MATE family efflux transporter n=1 Tax=Ureaplasma miroungigenitalium TaxID=1042321 RepID=UPI0021E93FDA|nr:MATE family efflux transporter [Ureaplasma miroungigenitalium]MCV3734333.1 MATE family efflux transporter [Ureaplasma miroungigenitalium]
MQNTSKQNFWTKHFGTKEFAKIICKQFFPTVINFIILTIIPMVGSFLLAAFNVGSHGTEAKTAAILAIEVMFLPVILMTAITSMGATLGAQYYGRKDFVRFKETMNFSIFVGLITAVVITIIAMSIPNQLIALFSGSKLKDNATPEQIASFKLTNELAASYLRIVIASLIPFIVSFTFATAFRQDKATFWPLISSSVALAINIILAAILVKVFEHDYYNATMAVAGCTLIARFSNALFLVILSLFKKTRPYYIFNHLRISKLVFKQVVKVGWQIVINEFLFALGTTVILGFMLNYYSDKRDSIATVSLLIQFIALMWPGSAAVTAVVVTAELGAQRNDLAKQNARRLINWSFIAATLLSIIILILSTFVNQLLNPPTDDSIAAKERAEAIVKTATYLEYVLLVRVMFEFPFAFMYSAIKSGGSKFLLAMDILSVVIWMIIIGLMTNVNVDPNNKYNIYLLFFIMYAENIFKFALGWIIFSKTKWNKTVIHTEEGLNENTTNKQV